MAIGYDNWRPNQDLLLDLQFREGTGTAIMDWAKPYRTKLTATGAPAWAFLGSDLAYLDFNLANPDRLVSVAGASTDLDFTTGAFSGAVWIAPDSYGNRWLMHKSSAGNGWGFWIAATAPYLVFTTEQAGPTYQSTTGGTTLQVSTWQFVGFTRSGATGRIYLNGRDRTDAPATHVDPVTAAAADFYIGTTVGAGAGWYDGKMWRPRIWNRALAAWELLAIYEVERRLFGV